MCRWRAPTASWVSIWSSDGSGRPYRCRVRPPCFALMQGLQKMLQGGMVADVVATFGTINMIAGENDR